MDAAIMNINQLDDRKPLLALDAGQFTSDYNPYFFCYADAPHFSHVLTKPNRIFVEVSTRAGYANSLQWLRDKAPDFGLAITSEMAHSSDISHHITACLHYRFGLHRLTFGDVQTCLQEAIANSLIHGNLGLNHACNTLDDFNHFYTLLAQYLDNTQYRHKHICITASYYGGSLTIGVTHTGKGILDDAHILACHPVSAQQKTGRGLHLIHTLAQQVWCNDNGKSLYFSFCA